MPDDRCCPGSSLLRIGIICVVAMGALTAAQFAYRGEESPKETPPPAKAAAPAELSPLAQTTAAVLKTDGNYVLTVGRASAAARNLNGTLFIELVGPDDKVLADARRELHATGQPASERVPLGVPDVAADKLKVRLSCGTDRHEVALTSVLVAKGHETSLSAGQEFHAGSPAGLRCDVHGVKSLTETLPLTGADVEIVLRGPDKKLTPLYKGKAGADGVATADFKMPVIPPGTYAMLVTTHSDLGEEKLEHQIRVKAEHKVLLVTDKPLYQPGQVMHIRALTLRPFDLVPVAEQELTFEVEDGKGNKVFKRSHKTSEYGIASVDFELADEVNMGDYQIRATLGATQAQKTVAVKKYVLPKFKTEVKADKRYYAPKETIHADIQTDYFFGKPVAGAKIKVKASTFDVAFKDFLTVDTTTDANGHAKVDVALPDYFIGQPLQKGDGMVKLEIKVTDTADHSETLNKTYTVSEQPIRVSLIPDGGRLVPGMDNRVFAAALYPDGSPAKCLVKLWLGREAKGEPAFALQTNESGLAEFTVKPEAKQFRQAEWGQRQVEMLGGQAPVLWAPRLLLDLTAEAKDDKGNLARTVSEVNADMHGENVLLRLDKAIYHGGDTMNVDVRTSGGMPTAYLDIVRSGQTLLTRWLDVKDGKAMHKLDLPANVFGTLEIHAYQIMASGEIVRDSRVVYVHPREDLKIDVQPDKKVYLPGEEGKITFRVTDSYGKPTPAALGVLIVDEAVYALQEMQPGLEKVYFTLQEELLKPSAQLSYKPHDSINDLVREQKVPAEKQQIALALLASVQPKPPARWEVAPQVDRQRKAEQLLQQLGFSLYNYANQGKEVVVYDRETKQMKFRPGLLEEMVKIGWFQKEFLTDPFGGSLSLDNMARLESRFTADRLATALTQQREQTLASLVVQYSSNKQDKFLKDGRWSFPETILSDTIEFHAEQNKNNPDYGKTLRSWLKDAWGREFRLVKVEKKREHQTGWSQFDFHEIVSAGPDGKFGTADDVKPVSPNEWHLVQWWWLGDTALLRQQLAQQIMPRRGGFGRRDRMMLQEADMLNKAEMMVPRAAGAQFERAAADGRDFDKALKDDKAGAKPGEGGGNGGGGAPPIKVREYFPETLLWQPALITDEKGVATLPLTFADSITTWRLSASASSRYGLLGGQSASLRVFQDFFVDLDLPVALTQNDEVSFPVAVYNYLPGEQTVTLELEKADWFEMLDSEGYTRSLKVKSGDVTSVKFRIKARRIGAQPLTVKARGSSMSDAIKRSIDVLPDGQRVEQVFADRLNGKASQHIVIPGSALPDASKILVKVYPGVISQVMEGMDGMLRMPNGCMEQTSSSAYPNVLVVDYLKKSKTGSPAVMMRAEQFLNVGYQRLLTFERPGGGFDWWGNGPPLVWLSAYALHEFNDMAKVYPIDKGVIDRTQAWLLKQQSPDGTWSNIGATHSETIAQMGDPKLLLTSYVAWSLRDSGFTGPQLDKAIEYIRAHIEDAKDNAYILALAANALASYDAQDDSTFSVLRKLEKLKVENAEWKACSFPSSGRAITYARGDSVTVETTAMTALAMLKNGQFTNTVNQSLTYLMKVKQGGGHWGSTSATILSVKALIAGLGGAKQEKKATFTILVNGKEAAKGEVTAENSDVMQLFDLKGITLTGANDIEIQVDGQTSLMYQIVARHYEPWKKDTEPKKQVLDVAVDYDRTELSTSDLLRAKATLKYNGDAPTYQVILDLPIPPGFTADGGDFAELVAKKKTSKVEKFSITAKQIILYVGDVKPGEALTFEYSLKPKYPIKAKTPAAVAYEYYTPANRATAAPVELTVTDKGK